MNNNKIVVIFTVIILFFLILVPSVKKVVDDKKNNHLLVLKKKILLKAKLCWDESKCTNNKIYLQDLYDLEYLSKLVNPNTKEYVNSNSYIEKTGEKITVTLVD